MMRPVKTSFSRHKTFGIIFDIYYFQKISASRVFTAETENFTLNVHCQLCAPALLAFTKRSD